ncbi:MAG: aminoglycoside phosphotransferase family protein [Oscillospiraceae bacterium]|nr:aminoglycoside phosphotransferase family protein [Oscillospiraceae bacterium]
MLSKTEINNILKILNIVAETIKIFKEKDKFTEYLLDEKYILRISESELTEQKKNYRVNSLSFVSKIHSSGSVTVSDRKYYHLLFDYIQGNDLFNAIQNLTDEQKYNIGKEIAQFLSELHSITDTSYDMGHYIPVVPRYKGIWKNGHLEYAKLLRTGLSETDLKLNSKKVISKAFDYIYANIRSLEYQTGARLLHNDFHPKNIIVHKGRLAGITDWECSQFGEADFELTHLFHWHFYLIPDNNLEILLKSVVENLHAVLYIPNIEKRLTIYQLEHDLNQLIWRGRIQEEERIYKINGWLNGQIRALFEKWQTK